MSWEEFWFVLIGCVLAMWACRVVPLFLLKGRELPPRLAQALGFIPPAAFAALVANDLLNPGMFDAGVWPGGRLPLGPLLGDQGGAGARRPFRWWPPWPRRSWP